MIKGENVAEDGGRDSSRWLGTIRAGNVAGEVKRYDQWDEGRDRQQEYPLLYGQGGESWGSEFW